MFDSQLGKEFLHTFRHYLVKNNTHNLEDFEFINYGKEGYHYREKVWSEWKTFTPQNVEIVNLAEEK